MEILDATVTILTAYVVLGLILVVVIWRQQQSHEPGPKAAPPLSDPYMIAFLRGDRGFFSNSASNFKNQRYEFLITVMISLIDRGLLSLKPQTGILDSRLNAVRAEKVPSDAGNNPIEQTLLQKYSTPHNIQSILWDLCEGNNANLSRICRQYEIALEQLGLLPGSVIYAARLKRCFLGGAALWSVPAMEWSVGLFPVSVAPAVIFTIVLGHIFLRARTPRGDAMLIDMQKYFTGLREGADGFRPHQSLDAVVFASALFGPRILLNGNFSYVSEFYPLPNEWMGGGLWRMGRRQGY